VAIKLIRQGEDVVKYGFSIGRATQEIQPGKHVHTHNLKTNLEGVEEYVYEPKQYLDCPTLLLRHILKLSFVKTVT